MNQQPGDRQGRQGRSPPSSPTFPPSPRPRSNLTIVANSQNDLTHHPQPLGPKDWGRPQLCQLPPQRGRDHLGHLFHLLVCHGLQRSLCSGEKVSKKRQQEEIEVEEAKSEQEEEAAKLCSVATSSEQKPEANNCRRSLVHPDTSIHREKTTRARKTNRVGETKKFLLISNFTGSSPNTGQKCD